MNDFYLIEYQAKANYQLSTVHLLIFTASVIQCVTRLSA